MSKLRGFQSSLSLKAKDRPFGKAKIPHDFPNLIKAAPPTFIADLTGLVPNDEYQVSFWAADAEISLSSAKNRIEVFLDGSSTSAFDTGLITNASTDELIWFRYSFLAPVGPTGELNLEVRPTEAGSGGRDLHIDEIRVEHCIVTGVTLVKNFASFSDTNSNGILGDAGDTGTDEDGASIGSPGTTETEEADGSLDGKPEMIRQSRGSVLRVRQAS